MFLVVLGALVLLVAAVDQTTCPTQLFQTADAYDLAVGNNGLSIQWWLQNCDLIALNGTSQAGAFSAGNPCTTPPTISNGATFKKATGIQLFSLAQLQAAPNQEQNLFIFANVNTTSDSGCFLTIGAPSPVTAHLPDVLESDVGGICLSQRTLNISGVLKTGGFVSFPGGYEFPISFGNTQVGFSEPIAIHIRRYLDAHNNILLDFQVLTGGGKTADGVTTIAASSANGTAAFGNGVFFDLKSSAIEFESGSNTTTINNVLVLQGTLKSEINQTVSGVLANGLAFAAQTLPTTCVDETWTTSGLAAVINGTTATPTSGFVVPAGITTLNNARLTYTRTNYGGVNTTSQIVTFKLASDIDTTNSTRATFFADGLQFLAGTLASSLSLGPNTGGGTSSLSVNVNGTVFTSTSAHGQSTSLQFTFGVEQCTITALPLEFGTVSDDPRYPAPTSFANIVGAISVASNSSGITTPAYMFIQRQSELTAVVSDLRNFDSNGRPIAVGCNVPLTYTFDVFNNGPSCASNLLFDMHSGIFTVPGISVPSAATYFINTSIPAGTLSPQTAFTVVINANGTTENLAGAARFVNLLAPTLDCISSSDTNLQCASAGQPLFRLFYDVQAYADISITSQQVTPSGTSVTAGDFSSNLAIQLNVTSHGCSPVNGVTIDIDIETPEGVVFFDIVGDGTLNNKTTNYGVQVYADQRFIRRTVNLGNFAPGQSKTILLEFVVCQNARAGAGGVRVTARYSPQSSLPDQDVLQSATQTGATVAFADTTTSATDVKIVNPEDDQTTIVGKVNNQATIHITQSCTEPIVIPRGVRPEAVFEDDEDESESLIGNRWARHHHEHEHHGRVEDVEIEKFSVCTLSVFNDGASDVALRIRNEWDLPSGVHVAKWETTGGVFSNNVWVVDTPSISSTSTSKFVDNSNQCPARVTTQPVTLTVTLVAKKHGIVQWVSKLDTTASAASFGTNSDTGKFTSIVF